MNNCFQDIIAVEAMLNEIKDVVRNYVDKETKITVNVTQKEADGNKILTIHVDDITDVEVKFKVF